ncbi:hypothetical protein HYPSUDRAFT_55884 [Hypholoma sublateritium FD-334 SS-4]|uniref:Uncharacterized protein n=1 Tax=Hypholoma sublateritium (strain FD-334 SS-4) TaxID=945553 RepID=A0A0D2MBE6_HYPSF|nr:hypothetical protein HYPSUDRAFT_55884 [Hypholoma sublateritium FD-334 SS-4]
MASFYPKRYVNRAIQTDSDYTQFLTQPLSQGDTLTPIVSLSSSLVEQQAIQQKPTDIRTQLGAQDDAYTQSPTPETAVDVAEMTSRSVPKQPGIGSGQPSGQISSTKRLASLPNITDTGEIAVRLERQARIVSMPERNCDGKLQHTRVGDADTSGSTDISYYSADSGKGCTRQEVGTERIYPVDLPQTPSPPSSPESVMIIANESQVSGSFLRRSCTDEDGWISWASSPPRPIPALHGPLSLPYARCPSGAEGTLIEGDDLSSQIWGLGIQDDVQGQNSRMAKTPVNQVLRQHGGSQSPSSILRKPVNHDELGQASCQRGRDTVIDLSKPLTFRNHVDLSGAPRNYPYDLNRQPQAFVPAAARNILSEIPARRNSDGRCHNAPETRNTLHIKPSGHALRANESFSSPRGLGLNWNGGFSSFESANSGPSSGLNHPDPRSRLNTAAPVFVPGQTNRSNITSGTAYMHPVNGSGNLSLAGQRDSLSRPNFVAQHKSPHTYHPPTPSTASPRWPPVFLQSHEYDSKNPQITRYDQQSAMHRAPKVYSPQLDLDDYAKRLRVMMEQLRGDNNNYNIPESMHDTPLSQKNATATQVHPRAPVRHGVALYEYIEAAHTPLVITSTVHEPTLDQEIEQVENTDTLPFSSERRRNLSYQHPRSIPLARLIQRRLSSVVEEDTVRDSLLPLLRKRASELPAQASNREPTSTQGIDDKGNVHDVGPEMNIELAVSVEGPLMYPGGASAVVNLPKHTTTVYSSGGPMKSHKSPRNDTGSRKENVGAANTSITEFANQGKQKIRQKKSDTVPLRQATNPTL